MRATSNTMRYIAAITAVFISTISNIASALLINFDELTPVYLDPEAPFFADNPITDQYASQGVVFLGGAWLNGFDSQNYMTMGAGGAMLQFTGILPTLVSMEVTSIHNDAIFFNMTDASGSIIDKNTAGWRGPFYEHIPAIPNELITFTSELGISSINMFGFFDLRNEANIDNITITYSSVPEPSSLALFALALLAVIVRQTKTRSLAPQH